MIEFIYHICILIGLYVILSVSLNLVIGQLGFLSIAHASFYGVGAYTVAILTLHYNFPYLLAMVCGATFSGVFGILLGLTSLRLNDDYLVITTFAFQIVFFNLFNNLIKITGGPMGIRGIPNPVLLGFQISSNAEFVILVMFCSALMLIIYHRIVHSPYGRVLKAIREDEVFASSLGKRTSVYKLTVFAISASFAGLAGTLFAPFISFVDPTSFMAMESIFIISIVIIGGTGSTFGPVIGSILLVSAPEILRFVGVPSAILGNIRQIMYGSLLVAFIIWRPAGILGKISDIRKGTYYE